MDRQNKDGHNAEAEATPLWKNGDAEADLSEWSDSVFASRYMAEPMSKFEFPSAGAPAHVVYQLINDLRTLDATPRLNLASFVTTWMEPEAQKLISESLDVNYVDTEEYPASTEIQNRCVEMLARLFHSPAPKGQAVGTACVGSSEAIMLGALAMKKRWQEARKAAGKDTSKPNLVMGAQVHVCWEKFCNYFDVERRLVYCEPGRYSATAELIEPLIDENTIGVAAVLGSTYTGEFEDVEALNAMVGEVNKKNGWNVVIHIDGASGAFVAPFLYPDLKWDFQLEHVASINASGHKYGLVYPGLGWVMWRSEEYLPESMVFLANYLGTVERSVTLNFSKGASTIIAQYYQFLRLGFGGFQKIMRNLDMAKKRLTLALQRTGHFEIMSQEMGVPLVAFRLTKVIGSDGKEHHRLYNEFDLADRLRMKGWVVPAYTMAPKAEEITMMRVTIREQFTMHTVDQLVGDIHQALDWLDTHYIYTEEQMKDITKRVLGKQLSRFDSSILRARPSLKPC